MTFLRWVIAYDIVRHPDGQVSVKSAATLLANFVVAWFMVLISTSWKDEREM